MHMHTCQIKQNVILFGTEGIEKNILVYNC
jgi:hypothetical protein